MQPLAYIYNVAPEGSEPEWQEIGRAYRTNADVVPVIAFSAYEAQAKRISDLEQVLKSIERYVNHHGQNPKITAQEALSMVQHHPYILQITKSYKDGIIPNTCNPYAEIKRLKTENEDQKKRIAELEQQNQIYRSAMLDQMFANGAQIEGAASKNGDSK